MSSFVFKGRALTYVWGPYDAVTLSGRAPGPGVAVLVASLGHPHSYESLRGVWPAQVSVAFSSSPYLPLPPPPPPPFLLLFLLPVFPPFSFSSLSSSLSPSSLLLYLSPLSHLQSGLWVQHVHDALARIPHGQRTGEGGVCGQWGAQTVLPLSLLGSPLPAGSGDLRKPPVAG